MYIILSIFILLLLFYIYFLISISNGILKVSNQRNILSVDEYISIIIPFRNEKDNILHSLKSVTNQSLSHNQYEVLYIDDNSEDDSFNILKSAEKPENIFIYKSPFTSEEKAHKKKALNFAIQKAKGEIIITTDADCTHKTEWLETMVSYFDKKTAFVSGPVEFYSNKTLFQNLQKIEFSSLILVGAGLIGNNTPIICNAANLGFRKSIFNKVGGYKDNLNLSSGDDEFLMQKIHRQTDFKIKFCFNKDAISSTAPNASIDEFYQQRRRWASKGFHYVDKNITLKLIAIFLFYLSLPIQILLGIFVNPVFIISGVGSFVLKIIFEFKIVQIDSKNLFGRSGNMIFLIAEFLHIPYILVSGFAGLFGNYKWKGRTIKR
jgi:cellulose synthase/poly-beta-1,6-N-acetylglucosamine synthase-like glycosyltransferase